MSRLLISFLLFVFVVSGKSGGSHGGKKQPDYYADSHYAYYSEEFSFFPPFSFDNHFKLPNWEYGGSTMVFEDRVVLTPDLPSRSGWLWSETPSTLAKWEAIYSIKIGGRGRLSGDGMAFWVVENPKRPGKVFGNEDNWRGLGVLIDTYDNNMDNKHPYLAVAFNDGTKSWDHDNDGGDMTTYGCKIQPRFRNKGVLQVVVSNLGEHLQVLLYEEDTSKWFDCVNMTIDSSIFRPSISRYFGFTATTGSVTDKHELMSFELYDMQKMGEDGHHHEHVKKSELHSSDDSSGFFSFATLFYFFAFLIIAVVGYVAVLFFRTQSDKKKKGTII